MKAIYGSSYDRGLDCLLEMWPYIHERVPEATLDIYYGWDSFDMVHKGNAEMMKWKWGIIRKLSKLKSQGVTEHGRVDHQTLAQKFKEAKVWLYPTQFNEIHCITALKAQIAGCIPVTTGCYALEETVINNDFTAPSKDVYKNGDAQKEFIDKAVAALQAEDYQVKTSPEWSWEAVASRWSAAL